MAGLLIASFTASSGKTTLAAGIGKYLQGQGKRVGYFKPVIGMAELQGDAALLKEIFSLDEPVEVIAPAYHDIDELKGNLKKACDKAARGKDVTIIEAETADRQMLGEIAAALSAHILFIDSYSDQLPGIIISYKSFGKAALGFVVNKVPRKRLEAVRDSLAYFAVHEATPLLGVLPEDRLLLSLTVNEMAGKISGEVVGKEGADELVENVMVGALCADPGVAYFSRKSNKVVVLKSERADMQLAAVQTPVKCLVVTGNTPPKDAIVAQVEEKQVPIVRTSQDVTGVIERIEAAIGNSRFNTAKLPRAMELLQANLNLEAIIKGLG